MVQSRTSRRKAKRLKISEILRNIERRAPDSCSESWDNNGLLVGDPSWSTSTAVVSVDLTEESLALAKRVGAKLIVNHHPCIFPRSRGIARVAPPSLVWKAIDAQVAVLACHTNFDRCALEVPQQISKALGVKVLGRLLEKPTESLKKLVVFVPDSHVDSVHAALSSASAGHVGNYDHCAFIAPGEGRFRGGDSTNPFLGKAGRLERAQELRLETIFPAGMEQIVLQALRASHPYEEIAYDIYSVEQKASSEGMTSGLGYGFYGDFNQATSIQSLVKKLVRTFEASGAVLTPAGGKASEKGKASSRRMGFVAGKGSSFISAALAARCDVFVTGEVDYHEALSAARRGMTVVELGHRESERFYLKTMSSWLQEMGLKPVEQNTPLQTISCP
ncbi:MAG: Nif3-like dinuclear metal center hexameric protein [Bdellovibrionales bacterium]|nr:Nif3-like dinuclear metal center hexameric protein [Bdellovibrionales bacterium]